MDNTGDFLGPPHGTTPAAEIGNENIKSSSFESNKNTQTEHWPFYAISDHESSSVILTDLDIK